jgi:hypothetical protein
VPILIKILAKETRIHTKLCDCNKLVSTLEVFMVLLKETTSFATKPRNVKHCVFLISKVAHDYNQTPAITQPIIGSLLTLRDLNLKATMSNLSKLDSKYLRNIEWLAKQYAPDLDQNIKEHVV